MNQINYQKGMEKIITENQKKGKIPKLLLHVCCAPCSSYVLEYLSDFFDITVFFYNPNISTDSEYSHRAGELLRFVKEKPLKRNVQVLIEEYHPDEFYDTIKGLEECPERGERCFQCYRLRLEKTAQTAIRGGYDYFTTTLSVSPLKNAKKLNEIGAALAQKYDVPYLYSDFKKKNGYIRSVELSKEYQLYRQNFCGCKFSKKENV